MPKIGVEFSTNENYSKIQVALTATDGKELSVPEIVGALNSVIQVLLGDNPAGIPGISNVTFDQRNKDAQTH